MRLESKDTTSGLATTSPPPPPLLLQLGGHDLPGVRSKRKVRPSCASSRRSSVVQVTPAPRQGDVQDVSGTSSFPVTHRPLPQSCVPRRAAAAGTGNTGHCLVTRRGVWYLIIIRGSRQPLPRLPSGRAAQAACSASSQRRSSSSFLHLVCVIARECPHPSTHCYEVVFVFHPAGSSSIPDHNGSSSNSTQHH